MRPCKCAECGRGFRDAHSLGLHARTHTGDRPLACGLCAAKFAARGTLRKHLRCVHLCGADDGVFIAEQLREHKATHVNDVGEESRGGLVEWGGEQGVGLEEVTEQDAVVLEVVDQRVEMNY